MLTQEKWEAQTEQAVRILKRGQGVISAIDRDSSLRCILALNRYILDNALTKQRGKRKFLGAGDFLPGGLDKRRKMKPTPARDQTGSCP